MADTSAHQEDSGTISSNRFLPILPIAQSCSAGMTHDDSSRIAWGVPPVPACRAFPASLARLAWVCHL